MDKKTRVQIAKVLITAADALDGGGKKVKAGRGDVGKIYVANLAAYNNGKLVGEWITPDTDADTVGEQIAEVIGNPDDEWAIHDYDDFPNLGEHPSMDDIATVARMQEEHDPEAVEAAMAISSDPAEAMDLLEEGYGVYDDEEDYAYQRIDDMGGVSELGAEVVLSYVDLARLARDLEQDVTFVSANGSTYAFSKHV